LTSNDKSRLPLSVKDGFLGDLFKDWVPEIRPEKWLMRLPSDVVKDTEPRGKTVLDIGTGRGRFAIAFAEAGAERIVAVDISPAMLELARESANRWKVQDKISFEIGDVEGLKYPDNSFDIVCGMSVSCHLPYPSKAISELVRVCKVGGLIVFDAPINEPPKQGPYWKSFTEDEFRKLFEIPSVKVEVWRRYSLPGVETSTITCVARKQNLKITEDNG
jgi:ubiquinone/menaquinone biosynthesis C-methylase UbiE